MLLKDFLDFDLCILYIVSNIDINTILISGNTNTLGFGLLGLVGIECAQTTRVTDALKMCCHTSRTQCNYCPHVGSPLLFIGTGITWHDDIWCVHVVTFRYILGHILYWVNIYI